MSEDLEAGEDEEVVEVARLQDRLAIVLPAVFAIVPAEDFESDALHELPVLSPLFSLQPALSPF